MPIDARDREASRDRLAGELTTEDVIVARTAHRVLDCLAWLIGAVAVGAGLLRLSAVGLFGSAWLYDGRRFRSLVWTLTDPTS